MVKLQGFYSQIFMQFISLLLGCSVFVSEQVLWFVFTKNHLKFLAYFERHYLATHTLLQLGFLISQTTPACNHIKYVSGTPTHLNFLTILESSQGRDESLLER